MDTTARVAIAGIAATLLGTLLAPVLAGRTHRKSVRAEQLRAERLKVYADLLRVTARVADNAMTWSAIPLAELKETGDDELDRVVSQARVVASKKVYACLGELMRLASEFNRQHFEARIYHQRVHDEGHADDENSIKQRMSLGEIADKMVQSYKQIEAAIRDEMS
jgi:hypothetical protein